MRLSRGIATLLLAFAAGAAAAAAAAKYAGPDDPATLAGARAALGAAHVLDLETPKVLDIVGMTQGIVGVTRGIESALKDLGAKVTAQEIRIELAADVLFDFDKHNLRPEAIPSL